MPQKTKNYKFLSKSLTRPKNNGKIIMLQTRETFEVSNFLLKTHYVPLAQLDRALVYGTKGRAFESPMAHHS